MCCNSDRIFYIQASLRLLPIQNEDKLDWVGVGKILINGSTRIGKQTNSFVA